MTDSSTQFQNFRFQNVNDEICFWDRKKANKQVTYFRIDRKYVRHNGPRNNEMITKMDYEAL